MKRFLILLMAFAVMAAACTGDGDEDAGGDEEGSETTEGTETTEGSETTEGGDTSGEEVEPVDPDMCPTITNPGDPGADRPAPADNGDARPEVVSLATYQEGQLKHGTEPVVENARTNACSKMADLPVLECSPGDDVREAYIDLTGYLISNGEEVQRVELEDPEERALTELGTDELIELLNTELSLPRAGREVGFEYVFLGQMGYGVHPATNPTRVDKGAYEAVGYPRDQIPGGDTPVVVLDTGRPDELPDVDFLDALAPAVSQDIEGPPAVTPTSDPGIAHGLMVAGIVGQAAPDTPIEVYNAEDLSLTGGDPGGGLFTVTSIAAALARRPADVPSVINMSFGTYGCDPDRLVAAGFDAGLIGDLVDRGVFGPQAVGDTPMRQYMEGLAARHLLVASAGNNATTLPMFPAALPSVIGVGAIDDTVPNLTTSSGGAFFCGDGHAWQTSDPVPGPGCDPDPAAWPWFSNRGDGVDVCAPGTDMVTAYPEGLDFGYLAYDHGTMTSTVVSIDDPGPLAMVSGTSLAAPHAAGLLAATGALDVWTAVWADGDGSVAEFLQAFHTGGLLPECPQITS